MNHQNPGAINTEDQIFDAIESVVTAKTDEELRLAAFELRASINTHALVSQFSGGEYDQV